MSSEEQSDSSLISELPKVPEKCAITALKNNYIKKKHVLLKQKMQHFHKHVKI